MSEQLSIFASGIYCWHCNNDPGRHPNNANLWHGFFDADTQQRVCWNCRDHHYGLKGKTEFARRYSEVPMVVEYILLTDKIKKPKKHEQPK